MQQPRSHEIRLSVPFHDLDPMDVVWHGNYLKYFDMARFALFREAGIDLYRYSRENSCLFPVIRTLTKHILPLKYEDAFICRAEVREAAIKIVIDFEIRRTEDGQVCARGRGEQVAVKLPEMETLYEIPADVRRALGVEPWKR